MQFNNDKLSAFSFNYQNLQHQDEILASSKRIRDAIQVLMEDGEAWLFDYGVAVLWGASESQRHQLLSTLGITEDKLAEYRQEHLSFTFDSNSRVSADTVTLTNNDSLTRLAVSHALAQSIKLNAYENQAVQTIEQYAHLPKELAETGTIKLSRKQTAKIRGRLFNTKNEIILQYGLFDIPEFFWEYPEYEANYHLLANYLEINQRVELLKLKLDTIQQLFHMLADEQKHQHSAFLEWIIIILIAIEIVIFIGQEIKLFL